MPDASRSTRLSPAPDPRYTDFRGRQQDMVQMEESGTFWLWAWPEILGWPVEITWLFSPITGNYPWPGDLWGVDASGELLIVETKPSSTRADPFEDFLDCERRRASEGAFPPTVDQIRTRWEKALHSERRFLNVNRDALRVGSEPRNPGPGLLPNSCKRLMTWRWRGLYLGAIAPIIASAEYEHAVVSALDRLASRSNRFPHYFGLFTIISSARPSLSAVGKERYEALRALVSPARVHLRAIECAGPTSPEQVEIACWHPTLRA